MQMLKIEERFKGLFPALAKKFVIKSFQIEAINSLVEAGNTLCIMPTGGGKSLVYWMSGLLLDGITVVISPLIALIDEQSEKLKEQGIEVLSIHGGMDAAKQAKVLIDFANHIINPKFIFVSPEKIATDGLFEYCMNKRKSEFKLLTIDEVHCVSQWGSSFRPFYKRIPDFLNNLFGSYKMWPKVLALTATLNPKEVIDICTEFKINKSNILRDNLLMRSEISLKILKYTDENEKEQKLWDLLKIHYGEKILVYVYRKASERGVERLSEKAGEKGYKSVFFHGDMSDTERKEIIDKFKNNQIDVIFATNAFGMGIDIPDIRTVIHYMIPESVEQYYQEIGRAARDGKAANAYLLYTNKNIEVKRKYFIDGSFPSEEKLLNTFAKISNGNIGQGTLAYFEDEDIQKCLSYYLDSGLMKIECKGFSNLKSLSNVQDNDLNKIINGTTTKGLITTSKRANIPVNVLVQRVYEAIVNKKAVVLKPLDRRIVINALASCISPVEMDQILEQINKKCEYKHSLLDYLIYLIDDKPSSNELHQEIGKYLGVDKHSLNKVYLTSKGDRVRSKSEVIIANLLFEHKIPYEYEKKLYYDAGKWIEPDFTITLKNGKELYWEHLGMLGVEDYDKHWLEKIDIYNKFYKGKMIKSYEGTTLAKDTIEIINDLISRN